MRLTFSIRLLQDSENECQYSYDCFANACFPARICLYCKRSKCVRPAPLLVAANDRAKYVASLRCFGELKKPQRRAARRSRNQKSLNDSRTPHAL